MPLDLRSRQARRLALHASTAALVVPRPRTGRRGEALLCAQLLSAEGELACAERPGRRGPADSSTASQWPLRTCRALDQAPADVPAHLGERSRAAGPHFPRERDHRVDGRNGDPRHADTAPAPARLEISSWRACGDALAREQRECAAPARDDGWPMLLAAIRATPLGLLRTEASEAPRPTAANVIELVRPGGDCAAACTPRAR